MTLRLGRETLLHFASQLGVTLAGFIATFLIARIGGADVYGLYASAIAIMYWLNVPAVALGEAVTKRLSEGIDPRTYLGTGLVLEFIVAITAGIGLILASPALSRFVTAPLGPLVGSLVAINVLFITVRSVLQGEKRVPLSGWLSTIERVIRSALQVGVILLGYRVSALLASHVVATFVAVAIGFYLADLAPSKPTVSAGKSLLNYARFSWLGSLKTRAFGWMDTIILVTFAINPALIGIYEISWNIASVFALVAIAVKSTLFPELSDIAVDEGYDRIHHLLNEGLVFTGVFMIPGIFGALIIGRETLKIYGSEFTQGATILVLLVVARLVVAYGNQLLSVANAIDRPDVAFRVNAVFVATNLGLNVVLVTMYGWWGAAIATAISGCIVPVLGYLSVWTLIGRPAIPWSEITKQFVAAGAMAVVVLLLKGITPQNHYVTILLIGVGAAVYGGSLLAFSTRIRTKVSGLLPRATTS